MPEDGLINNDVSEAAAHLYDNAVMSKIITMFRLYYKQRVTLTPEEYYEMMTETKRVRLDLDDFCPYTGEDQDGNLKRPTELELDELFQQKGKRNSWSEGEKLYSGRPRNMMMPVIKTLEIYEKMMEFLVRAGYTPESLGFLMPMNRMQADAQGKQEMRVTISNFLRRLRNLSGARVIHLLSLREPRLPQLHRTPSFLGISEPEGERTESRTALCRPTMWHSFTSKLCQQDGLCYSAGRGRGAEGKDRDENEDGSNPWRRSGE